jgi:hypothetical protein
MGELTAADVDLYTGGRLLASDPEVQRTLNAALVIARREVGWYVSPVIEETVVLDGPGSRILNLPTRRLLTLTSVEEDGTALTLTDLTWAAGGPPGLLERPVSVRKRSRGWWSCDYQAIEVVMTHGYTEDEAADWRQAILQMVDQMSVVNTSGRGDADLVSKRVDDVTYSWSPSYTAAGEDALIGMRSILDDYRLPRLEFL